jgi:hypothetical protein
MALRPFLARPVALASSALALAGLVAAGGCGGNNNPTGPTTNAPIVRSVSPASGSTFGGTEVTLSGEKFVAGSTVTFGGTPGTNVAVENATTIRVTTPAHATGAVDVQVSGSTGGAMLAQSFTFVAPGGSNAPPVIKSVTAKGRKANEPTGFADLGETIDVTAIVEDAETALDKLTYQWTATAGSVTGTGPVVTWVAPAAATTPTDVTITLTVVESYKAPDASGLPVDKENKVTATAAVSLHNSPKEVGDMAYDFLVKFSTQVDVNTVMRDFAPPSLCAGAAAERADVTKNQAERKIVAYTIGTPAVTINFGGTCPFRSVGGDACAQVSAKWTSQVLVHTTPTDYYLWFEEAGPGTDQVTALYRDRRWYLCASDYNAPAPTYHK